jgi:mannosyltransferase
LAGSGVPLHGPQAGAGRDGQAPTPDPADSAGLTGSAKATGSVSVPAAGAVGIASPAWFVPVVPAICAFAVGMYGIARPSLWRDEAYTIEVASRSPGQILSLLRNADVVHGAYYLCMHLVITLFGRSEAAVRLLSVAAAAVAAGFLAALGMRLAAASGLPSPRVSGLLAGLLYAVAPSVTVYAQDARSYATVSAFVVIATYLLVRAFEDQRRRWWVGYGMAIALAGMFNLLALLIVPAHGVTVAIVARRSRAARLRAGTLTAGSVSATRLNLEGGAGAIPAAGPPGEVRPAEAAVRPAPLAAAPRQARRRSGVLSWTVAVIAAVVVLIPLVTLAYAQRGATAWLGQPGPRQVGILLTSLAGSRVLIAPLGALIVIAVGARIAATRGRPLAIVDVALPWLLLPPAILLGISQIHPLYNFRYVVYCLPAVALLAADGLSWLAWFTGRYAAQRLPGPAVATAAWLPSLAVIVFIAAASVAPQQWARAAWSRPDYLRRVSEIVSMYARPGDAVLYVTAHSRIVSQGYPGPFRKLRDIALAESPVASATLNGREVDPAVLHSRFASVGRVWVVSDNGPVLPVVEDPLDVEKLALVRTMRPIGSWHTRNDLLVLYARR